MPPFLASLGFKGALYIGAGLLVLGGIFAVYTYHNGLLSKIETKTARIAQQKVALELAEQREAATIKRMKEFVEAQARQVQLLKEATEQSREAATELRRLDNVFRRHDLERLASKRPGLIERRVNTGTARALGLLGELTAGAERPPGGGAPKAD